MEKNMENEMETGGAYRDSRNLIQVTIFLLSQWKNFNLFVFNSLYSGIPTQ